MGCTFKVSDSYDVFFFKQGVALVM